jgi:hypothetical protein
VIGTTSEWPYFAATEYNFQTVSWVGAAAAAAPTDFRGLLPNDWVQGETQIDYQATVCTYLGQPITCTLSIWLDATGLQNWLSVSFDWNGGNCYAWVPQKSSNGAPCSWDLAQPAAGITLGPNSFILQGGGDEITPVPWTASPKPPLTSPF